MPPGDTAVVAKAPPPLSAADTIEAINLSPSRRLLVVLCFPLFLALAAPYWWATTSIERLPLPKERITALESARDVPIRTQIGFTADAGAFPVRPGKGDFPVETKLQSLADEVVKGVDGILGRDPPSARGQRRWDIVVDKRKAESAPLRVHIGLSDYANTSWPLEPYIQQAWGDMDVPVGTLVVPVNPQQIGDLNLKRHYKIALVSGIHNLLPPHLPQLENRALAYKPNITLSFVVLNEDASDGAYVDGWDIESALKDHFTPHLEQLAPVFNFSIESQVLYHAPLTFEPTFIGREEGSEDGVWHVDEDSMKVFVSERWSLDSHSTNNPVLRFLLFIPSAKHRPLQLPERASSFLIPQFGSVVVMNPPPSLPASAHHLDLPALDGPFAKFTSHLYKLLAIPALPEQLHPCPPRVEGTRAARGLPDPLTPWQMDNVLRVRLAENAAEARRTVAGIVRLVDKIAEMQVGPGVRDKVLSAVRKLEGLPVASRSKTPLSAFLLARDAVTAANDAFFDPAMMGLLYFPDQHKFAVYTPLFAPVGVAIVLGLLRELRAWLARRKKRAAARTGRVVMVGEKAVVVETVDGVDEVVPVAEDVVVGGETEATTSARAQRAARRRG